MDFLGFLKMLFNGLTMERTVCKFSNANLGCIDLIGRRIGNMLFYTISTMKVFNPGICIENISFHKQLVV